MAYGEAKDAGGLSPAKDGNETARHFIFSCKTLRKARHSDKISASNHN